MSTENLPCLAATDHCVNDTNPLVKREFYASITLFHTVQKSLSKIRTQHTSITTHFNLYCWWQERKKWNYGCTKFHKNQSHDSEICRQNTRRDEYTDMVVPLLQSHLQNKESGLRKLLHNKNTKMADGVCRVHIKYAAKTVTRRGDNTIRR